MRTRPLQPGSTRAIIRNWTGSASTAARSTSSLQGGELPHARRPRQARKNQLQDKSQLKFKKGTMSITLQNGSNETAAPAAMPSFAARMLALAYGGVAYFMLVGTFIYAICRAQCLAS